MGSEPRLETVLVSCGRDTLIPASTSTFPSGPVRTAILPPEPSSTLTFPRSLYEVIGEDAALSLMSVTSPRASAKACRALSQPPVDTNAAPVMQQRQKCRRESEPMRVPSLGTSRGLRGCNAPQLSVFQRTSNYFWWCFAFCAWSYFLGTGVNRLPRLRRYWHEIAVTIAGVWPKVG